MRIHFAGGLKAWTASTRTHGQARHLAWLLDPNNGSVRGAGFWVDVREWVCKAFVRLSTRMACLLVLKRTYGCCQATQLTFTTCAKACWQHGLFLTPHGLVIGSWWYQVSYHVCLIPTRCRDVPCCVPDLQQCFTLVIKLSFSNRMQHCMSKIYVLLLSQGICGLEGVIFDILHFLGVRFLWQDITCPGGRWHKRCSLFIHCQLFGNSRHIWFIHILTA